MIFYLKSFRTGLPKMCPFDMRIILSQKQSVFCRLRRNICSSLNYLEESNGSLAYNKSYYPEITFLWPIYMAWQTSNYWTLFFLIILLIALLSSEATANFLLPSEAQGRLNSFLVPMPYLPHCSYLSPCLLCIRGLWHSHVWGFPCVCI